VSCADSSCARSVAPAPNLVPWPPRSARISTTPQPMRHRGVPEPPRWVPSYGEWAWHVLLSPTLVRGVEAEMLPIVAGDRSDDLIRAARCGAAPERRVDDVRAACEAAFVAACDSWCGVIAFPSPSLRPKGPRSPRRS
jgi:hypothetical protein